MMFITDSAIMNFFQMKSSNKIWIFACCLYLGFLIFISTSATLKSFFYLLTNIPFANTFMHFLFLGLASFFSHLALSKRTVMLFGILFPQAPLIIALFCIIDELLRTFSSISTSGPINLLADLAGIIFFYFLAERIKLKS